MESITKRWRVLSGENKWKNILDPLDIDLRRYIIHYGELAQATYDTFNTEIESKYCGSSRYGKKDFFSKVGLEKTSPYKYTVTKFIYATAGIQVPDAFILKSLDPNAWSTDSNWIGYVAVATDEAKALLGRRDIVVAWRGTMTALEWVNDFQFILVPASGILADHIGQHPLMHHGWHSIYTSYKPQSKYNKMSARDQVLREVRRLVDLHKDEELSITVTGHSLGGAVATLNAVDLAANGYNKPTGQPEKACPVTAFAFASPRVGDIQFKKAAEELKDLHVLRIENALDIVPKYPALGYFDVGQELAIDTNRSPYLIMPGNVVSWHLLEPYLHAVAGTQGKWGAFKLEVDRDLALVNKWVHALKLEYLVPGAWWVEKNKGMVQEDNGVWKLKDHHEDDDE